MEKEDIPSEFYSLAERIDTLYAQREEHHREVKHYESFLEPYMNSSFPKRFFTYYLGSLGGIIRGKLKVRKMHEDAIHSLDEEIANEEQIFENKVHAYLMENDRNYKGLHILEGSLYEAKESLQAYADEFNRISSANVLVEYDPDAGRLLMEVQEQVRDNAEKITTLLDRDPTKAMQEIMNARKISPPWFRWAATRVMEQYDDYMTIIQGRIDRRANEFKYQVSPEKKRVRRIIEERYLDKEWDVST